MDSADSGDVRELLEGVNRSDMTSDIQKKILENGGDDRWPNPGQTRRGRLEETGILDTIYDHVSDGDLVLEIGCSKGYTTQEILQGPGEESTDIDVIGIDIADRFQNQDYYVQANGLQLPFAEDAVEFIVAPNSIGHLLSRGFAKEVGGELAKKQELLGEGWNALDRGGEVYEDQFVDYFLETTGEILDEGGYLMIADGSEYFLAERRREKFLQRYSTDEDRYGKWIEKTGTPSIAAD